MTAARVKMRFAPLPLRALCDPDLSALDLRILACVAWHDRLSLSRDGGQGCWASYETIAGEVRCHPTNASSSLAKLVRLAYLDKKPRPIDRRQHVFRVIYDQGEALSVGKGSFGGKGAETGTVPADPGQSGTPAKSAGVVCHPTNGGGEILCPPSAENGANPRETEAEYISLSDGIDFDESRERNSSQEAHLTARAPFDSIFSPAIEGASEAQGLGGMERGTSDGAQLAIFERAFRAGAFKGKPADLLEWVKWLDGVRESGLASSEGGRATRLFEEAAEALPDRHWREWEAWAEAGGAAAPAVDPPGVQAKVAEYLRGMNRAGHEALARRVGITGRELRDFAAGHGSLSIAKQSALRTATRAAA